MSIFAPLSSAQAPGGDFARAVQVNTPVPASLLGEDLLSSNLERGHPLCVSFPSFCAPSPRSLVPLLVVFLE